MSKYLRASREKTRCTFLRSALQGRSALQRLPRCRLYTLKRRAMRSGEIVSLPEVRDALSYVYVPWRLCFVFFFPHVLHVQVSLLSTRRDGSNRRSCDASRPTLTPILSLLRYTDPDTAPRPKRLSSCHCLIRTYLCPLVVAFDSLPFPKHVVGKKRGKKVLEVELRCAGVCKTPARSSTPWF